MELSLITSFILIIAENLKIILVFVIKFVFLPYACGSFSTRQIFISDWSLGQTDSKNINIKSIGVLVWSLEVVKVEIFFVELRDNWYIDSYWIEHAESEYHIEIVVVFEIMWEMLNF